VGAFVPPPIRGRLGGGIVSLRTHCPIPSCVPSPLRGEGQGEGAFSESPQPPPSPHTLRHAKLFPPTETKNLRGLDFSSWQGVLTSLIGIALFALIGIGIRLVMMTTIQQRQQRMNRQINERLKTLIAAYKVLGGSFTGRLSVDPRHLRDIRAAEKAAAEAGGEAVPPRSMSDETFERVRQVRDAVEAALSDIILLGTDEHVRLAEKAARELVAGNQVHTHELVVSLRNFIRQALDLTPIPADLDIPMQGPTRPSSAGGRGGRSGQGGPSREGGGQGGGGGAGGGGGGGMGMGMGLGGRAADDTISPPPGV